MLEVSNLRFNYDPQASVLSGITFSLASGERLGIVGDNGSGKTTLARLCCGLLSPTDGSVTVDGMDTRDNDRIFAVRSKVGLVFQDPEDQIVETTVEREIAFGLRNIGLSSEEIEKRVAESLETFAIAHLRVRPCNLLSAGEKQLVNIASVFAMRPRYIVLDESTSLLDPVARKHLLIALERLLDSTGAGLIFISNRLEDIWLCERIALLEGGRFSFLGTRQEFLENLLKAGQPVYGLWLLLKKLMSHLTDSRDLLIACDEFDAVSIARALATIGSGG